MSQEQATSGGCLCGAVRFHITGQLRQIVACHCGQCQKTHGGFGAYAAVARDTLVFDEERGLAWYASSEKAERGFCRKCGASLFWKPAFADYMAVAAGSLDQPSGLRLVRHIFTVDKPDWYEITDGLKQVPQSLYGLDES